MFDFVDQPNPAPPDRSLMYEMDKDVHMDDPMRANYELRGPQPSALPTLQLPSTKTPLEEHLERTGIARNDPGARLVRGLADKQNSAAASARTRSRSRQEREESLVAHLVVEHGPEMEELFKDYAECQAFFADRVPRPEAAAFKAALDKGAKKRSLEKRGKLLIYEQLGQAHQKLIQQA